MMKVFEKPWGSQSRRTANQRFLRKYGL